MLALSLKSFEDMAIEITENRRLGPPTII